MTSLTWAPGLGVEVCWMIAVMVVDGYTDIIFRLLIPVLILLHIAGFIRIKIISKGL